MKSVLLTAALLAATCGLAWLALSLDAHWQQVRQGVPMSQRWVVILRTLGAVAIAASLFACIQADDATMAVLVWVMALAGGALVVAFTLTWRPRALGWLVAFVRG
jgi:hypothetical protein